MAECRTLQDLKTLYPKRYQLFPIPESDDEGWFGAVLKIEGADLLISLPDKLIWKFSGAKDNSKFYCQLEENNSWDIPVKDIIEEHTFKSSDGIKYRFGVNEVTSLYPGNTIKYINTTAIPELSQSTIFMSSDGNYWDYPGEFQSIIDDAIISKLDNLTKSKSGAGIIDKANAVYGSDNDYTWLWLIGLAIGGYFLIKKVF